MRSGRFGWFIIGAAGAIMAGTVFAAGIGLAEVAPEQPAASSIEHTAPAWLEMPGEAPPTGPAAIEIRVIESDLAEPFVVCTIRAQVTTCKDLDLSTDHP